MRYFGAFPSGFIAAALALTGGVSVASDITVTRKLANEETLRTGPGEQIEVDFADGSVFVVGSGSLAELEATDGVLEKLDLVAGVFEVAAASGQSVSFQTGVCAIDAVDSVVRSVVGPLKTSFVFQSGAAVLIRSSAGVTNLTKVGTVVDVACATDGAAEGVREVTKDEVLVINQLLGQPDAIKLVDLVKGTDGENATETEGVSLTGFKSGSFLLPVSTSPDIGGIIDFVVSTAPSIGGGDFPCCGDNYFWGGGGGGEGLGNGKPPPNRSGPFDLGQLSPGGVQVGVLPSDVYDARTSAITDEIFFTLDPSARTATPDPSIVDEGLKVGDSNFAKLRLSEDIGLTRLSVDGENKDYVTFTYLNTRYALIAGTHTPSGQLATTNGYYIPDAYEVFRLTSGAVQTLSGFANGIGVDQAGSAYVYVTSSDLRISPNLSSGPTSSGVEIGPGVDASVSLALDGVAASALTLFGSARDDLSHYVDLASQEAGADQVSLASGEAVAGLNVPASVAKYGSYLDWGILRGRISAGGKTAQLLPTPWVAGREWSPSDLEGFKGTATYKGHTFGNVIDQNGARNVFGSYDNSWDFNAGTGTVSMDFDGTSYSGSTARTAGTIAFTGGVTAANRTGALAGKFYGNSRAGVAPDALGGTFSIEGTAASPYAANGVMAAGKQ